MGAGLRGARSLIWIKAAKRGRRWIAGLDTKGPVSMSFLTLLWVACLFAGFAILMSTLFWAWATQALDERRELAAAKRPKAAPSGQHDRLAA